MPPGTVAHRVFHPWKEADKPSGEYALSCEILRWLFPCFLIDTVAFLQETLRLLTHRNTLQFSRCSLSLLPQGPAKWKWEPLRGAAFISMRERRGLSPQKVTVQKGSSHLFWKSRFPKGQCAPCLFSKSRIANSPDSSERVLVLFGCKIADDGVCPMKLLASLTRARRMCWPQARYPCTCSRCVGLIVDSRTRSRSR